MPQIAKLRQDFWKKWLQINLICLIPTAIVTIWLDTLSRQGTSGLEYIVIYLMPLYLAAFLLFFANLVVLPFYVFHAAKLYRFDRNKKHILTAFVTLGVWALLVDTLIVNIQQ